VCSLQIARSLIVPDHLSAAIISDLCKEDALLRRTIVAKKLESSSPAKYDCGRSYENRQAFAPDQADLDEAFSKVLTFEVVSLF